MATMTREVSGKEGTKPAGFRTFMNVLRPIRDWLKNSPEPIKIEHHTPVGNRNAPLGATKLERPHSNTTGSGGSSSNSNSNHDASINGSMVLADVNRRLTPSFDLNVTSNERFRTSTANSMVTSTTLDRRTPIVNGMMAHHFPAPPHPPPAPPSHQRAAVMDHTIMAHHTPMMNNMSGGPIYQNGPALMASVESPPGSVATNGVDDHFRRTARSRMSLPIMQQNTLRRQAFSQLQRRGPQIPRSLGHIYLQHMGETKQANLPNELTTVDTIRALFVCAFPHMLTMEFMSQSHVKIYIYNPSCNIFYELSDIGDVRHESVLRVHQSDPLLALQQHYHTPINMMPRMHTPPRVPPPKPRRQMLPAGYSLVRLNHQ